MSMHAFEPCRHQQIRFFQRCWHVTVILLLTIAFASIDNAIAEEAKSESDSSVLQAEASVSDDSANTAAKRPATTTKADSQAAADSDKNSSLADQNDDEDKTPDPVELLNAIRKSYLEKMGFDKLDDDLILSQSSAYIFLNRKKIRDVSNNILDYWFLSSFEDDFNLIRFEFESVVIKPVSINLDSDIESQLLLVNNDFPMLDKSEVSIVLSAYVNYPIPESVMEYLSENSEDVVDKNPSRLVPETLSSYNYVVLFLAILGLSILGYVIYRIIVWSFLLDQNPEYDIHKQSHLSRKYCS